MADEGQDASSDGGDSDSAALGLSIGGASRERADEYLRKQSRLADLQIENLKKLDEFETSHLRWRRFNDQMKGALQIMLVAVGVLVVIAIGAAVWSASQAEGLVVDYFSVPPQFAQAGMPGDVIAGDLTHRIAAIRDTANANSIAHSKDVRLDRDEEIKVDIPDTGISLGEAARYLRSWLGHERHLDGSLRSLGNGRIALTVALGGADAQTFVGSDLGKLEQQAAEHVFQSFDPSNYIIYLYGSHRDNDVLPAVQHLIRVADSPGMLADGYSLWGNWTRNVAGDLPLAMKRLGIAASIDPKALPPHMEMMFTAADMGHDEEAVRQARLLPTFRQEEQFSWREGDGFAHVLEQGVLQIDTMTGRFDRAATDPCGFCSPTEDWYDRATFAARMHDVTRSRALIAEASASDGAGAEDAASARYFADAAAGDWHRAVADARTYGKAMTKSNTRLSEIKVRTIVSPLLAFALARSGDFAGAHAEIDKTQVDCVDCETARGNIDVLEKNWAGAAYWFARAVKQAPSIPFADTDWGEMLLRKGDYDAAIALFEKAHAAGPDFADPLEMWGEALIAKNRSDLALAKFAEAEKYAPKWGRLHLKWGEALLWSGDKPGAAKQFAAARLLNLTSPEARECAKICGQS